MLPYFNKDQHYCDDTNCYITDGVSIQGIIPCGDVVINGQCYSLNMKQVAVQCIDGVATIRFQTLGYDGVVMENNMANITSVENVASVACGDCDGR